MIMPSREIEEFAKILVKEVRDATIEECDSNFRPDVRDVIAQRWRKALGSGDADRIADVLIPDIVDATISYLLRALDQEMLPLTFKASNGKTVDLPKDGEGELVGWCFGGEGWREKYSRQRVFDDTTPEEKEALKKFARRWEKKYITCLNPANPNPPKTKTGRSKTGRP